MNEVRCSRRGALSLILALPSAIAQVPKQASQVPVQPAVMPPVMTYGRSLTERTLAVQASARELPAGVFQSVAARATYLEVVDKSARFSEVLARTDATRAGNAYWFATDRLDYVNRRAESLHASVAVGRPIQADMIQALSDSATPFSATVDSFAKRLTVEVRDRHGNHVPNLMVYSLPGFLVDQPEMYKDDKEEKFRDFILDRLNKYSFPNLSSPTTALIDREDARLWIGPPYKYDAMVPLVAEHKLAGKYATVSRTSLTSDTVTLLSPALYVSVP
ncbi:hypothetical protein BH10PSE17_BH10PSE17_03540 [soil metagenome]